MTPTIEQVVVLPASPARLFGMYLDAKQHAAFTGFPVSLKPKVGGAFRAFNGMLEGRFLEIVPRKLIVQAWRSSMFGKSDLDSILVLRFSAAERGSGRIELAHVGVPEHDHVGVSEGWAKYYWGPWRAYLTRKRKK